MHDIYLFDRYTGKYIGKSFANVIKGKVHLPDGATETPPPPYEEHKEIPVWNGESWYVTEDHRRYLDETGTPTGGTPYWLPGDNYQSEPRYTKEIGPLPEDALLERPAKTESEQKKEDLDKLVQESRSTLDNTDYRIIKFMDKYIQGHPEMLSEFNEEYPGTLAERQTARENINAAESEAKVAGIEIDG